MMSTIARRLRPERSVSAIIAAARGPCHSHVMSPAGMWRPAAAAPVKLGPFAIGGTRAGSGMPQLDMFTYMSQFTWLVALFFGYYIIMYNNGLPALARILKTRRILMEETKATASQGGKLYADADQRPLNEATKASVEYLYNSVNGASKWCTDVVKSLQASQLDGVNKTYLASLGDVTLSQVLKAKALDTIGPSTLHALSLADLQPAVHPKAYILRAQRSILGGKGKKVKRV